MLSRPSVLHTVDSLVMNLFGVIPNYDLILRCFGSQGLAASIFTDEWT